MDQLDYVEATRVAKLFVVCDQSAITPVSGNILRLQGVSGILEPSMETAIDRGSTELPDKVRNCSI